MRFWQILLLVFFITFLIRCSNTKKELDQFNKKFLEQETSLDIVSYLSQAGVTKARLNAPYMIRFTKDYNILEFTKGLHTEFFLNDNSKPQGIDTTIVESHIYAKYGRYTEQDSKVFLRDSVVCYNVIKQDTLWCDSLWWDQNKQIIYTWGNFKFKTHDGQNMHSAGTNAGFNAKQDLSEYTLYQSKGTMNAAEGVIPY